MKVIKGTQDKKRMEKGLAPSATVRVMRCSCGRQVGQSGNGEYRCTCGKTFKAIRM